MINFFHGHPLYRVNRFARGRVRGVVAPLAVAFCLLAGAGGTLGAAEAEAETEAETEAGAPLAPEAVGEAPVPDSLALDAPKTSDRGKFGLWAGTVVPLSAGVEVTWRFVSPLEMELHGGVLPSPYARLAGHLVGTAHEKVGAVVGDVLANSPSAGVGLRYFPMKNRGGFLHLSLTGVVFTGGVNLKSLEKSRPKGFPDQISPLPVPGGDGEGSDGDGGDVVRARLRGVMPMVGLSLGYRVELIKGVVVQTELGVSKSAGVGVEVTDVPGEATDRVIQDGKEALQELLWKYGYVPTGALSAGWLF